MTIKRAAIQAGFTALNQIGCRASRTANTATAGGRSPSGIRNVFKTIVNRSAWLVGAGERRPVSAEQRIGRMRDDIDRRTRELDGVKAKLLDCRGKLVLGREQSPEMRQLKRLAREIDALQESVPSRQSDAPRVMSAVILHGENGPTLEAHSPEVDHGATCVFNFDMRDTLTRMGVSCSGLPGTSLADGVDQVDAQALRARISAARMSLLGTPRGNEWPLVKQIARLEKACLTKAAALEQAKQALLTEIELPTVVDSSGPWHGPIQVTEL